jgi:hypothetical protein
MLRRVVTVTRVNAKRGGGATSEEEELDRLYGLPLDEFTAARNALSKRFREEGQRAIAARIKELPKPSVSAWLVNQLARRDELGVRRLIKTGAELEEAQRAAIAGGETADFTRARREEADAIKHLLDSAREVASAAGRPVSESVLDRVASTLRGAAATAEGREALARGRLAEDIQSIGFEALTNLAIAPRGGRAKRPPAPARKPPARSPAIERRRRKVREEERRARAEAQRLDREAQRLARDAREAEELARRKKQTADEARARAAAAKEKAERLGAEAANLQEPA